MVSTISFCFILILALFTRVVYSVPDEFCEDHFDDGDCGKPPISVLYYYKPGSRCEVRTWRGCPTLNKFPDYFSCLHFCVARIWGDPIDIPVLSASAEAVETTKAAIVAEMVEAQLEWKENIKKLEVKEMDVIDQLLNDVVLESNHPEEHHHEKLSFLQTEEDMNSGETTTLVSKTTEDDVDNSFSHEAVAIPWRYRRGVNVSSVTPL